MPLIRLSSTNATGVGAGAYQDALVPGRAAGDAPQLARDLAGFDAGPQRQGDQARYRLQQRGVAAAGLAHGAKHLEGQDRRGPTLTVTYILP